MAQDLTQDEFDIACLRHIATDAEVRRISLAAAMIKLHALAIARAKPALREEALEIVGYLEQLYAGLPSRQSLRRIVEEQPASARIPAHALDGFVEAIWRHFSDGRA